jgi:hypothetical protein
MKSTPPVQSNSEQRSAHAKALQQQQQHVCNRQGSPWFHKRKLPATAHQTTQSCHTVATQTLAAQCGVVEEL